MPRILKFDTNVRYDLLYCVKENQPLPCPFFFLSNQILLLILPFRANLQKLLLVLAHEKVRES